MIDEKNTIKEIEDRIAFLQNLVKEKKLTAFRLGDKVKVKFPETNAFSKFDGETATIIQRKERDRYVVDINGNEIEISNERIAGKV